MNLPWSERNSLLKGMRAENPNGLLCIMPKKHPLLFKIIGTTHLDHAPGRADRFPVFKLAKVDSDIPWVHLHRAL